MAGVWRRRSAGIAVGFGRRAGGETTLDYDRILRIVSKSGYRGYVGIEWEPQGAGLKVSDVKGIKATRVMPSKKMAALA